MDGAETVQIYVKVEQSDTPHAQLKGLKKVFLRKGETQSVKIRLREADFGLYGEDGKKRVTEGTCRIYIGTFQPDLRSQFLKGQKVEEFLVQVSQTRLC